MLKLKFYGAARRTSGSNFLLESSNTKGAISILVDCGLHQGSHFCEKHNFEPFKYDPKEVKAIFVSHAHIDHTGLIPKMYAHGFRGKVFSTGPTKDFAYELLLDSEDILKREAEREKKQPIYTKADVDSVMALWESVDYGGTVEVDGFKAIFKNAGHILGSASIIIEAEGKKIIFSGDLGNSHPALINKYDLIEEPVDYCLVESTYGDRLHGDLSAKEGILEDVVEETVKAGGVLMIPAFAMERTQMLLAQLDELVENGRIPRVPVFIDSPLAIRLSSIYKWYYDKFINEEAKKIIGTSRMFFDFPGLKVTNTTRQSIAINKVPAPKIIIAGSGMSNGGRILRHEARYLSDPKSTILFVGYQAEGTLGRRILDGEKTVKILREKVSVRARVVNIPEYSAHADQKDLLEWLYPMRKSLKKVFVVQGEQHASETLAVLIKDKLAVDAVAPSLNEEVILE
ncbi:MAG: MBL fold metallo-hydrolase [Candidatus Colwellbacteria bacterium]|nr:MBL fold metallo-hydrolase [Candidatus Colwellbacteria bacterium]